MICPICNSEIVGFPALSRQDNKTDICAECGQNEALADFAGMKIWQIKNAIVESVTPEALEHFNGMDDESVNELVVMAQRETVEAAAKELEAWTKKPL